MSSDEFNSDEIYAMNEVDEMPGNTEQDIANMLIKAQLNKFNRGNQGLFKEI